MSGRNGLTLLPVRSDSGRLPGMARPLRSLVSQVENSKPAWQQLANWRTFCIAVDSRERALVAEARDAGITWLEIGRLLGMTESAARRKYTDRRAA